LRSGHCGHGPQRKSIGVALVEDVPIINPPVDQTSICRAWTDKRGFKRDIGLQDVTGKLALLRVLGLLRHRSIRLDHLNDNRSDKRRGFAVIVDADLKLIEGGAGPSRASRHVSSLDVRNMFGGNASDPPQPASGPPQADCRKGENASEHGRRAFWRGENIRNIAPDKANNFGHAALPPPPTLRERRHRGLARRRIAMRRVAVRFRAVRIPGKDEVTSKQSGDHYSARETVQRREEEEAALRLRRTVALRARAF